MNIQKTKVSLTTLLIFTDIFAVLCAIVVSVYFRFNLLSQYFSTNAFNFTYVQMISFLVPLWLAVTIYCKLYKTVFIPAFEEFLRAFKVSVLFIILCTILSFSFKVDCSRFVFIFLMIFSSLFLFVFRQIVKFICFKVSVGFNIRIKELLIGSNVRTYKDVFKANPIHKIYFYPKKLSAEMIENIKSMVLKKEISQITLVDYNISESELLAFYDWAEYNNIIFKVIPSEIFMCRGEIKIDSSLGLPVFRFISDSLSGFNYFIKRSLDILISFFMLLILSPFLIVIAILIKAESRGPVIYSQTRQGYRGKSFKFYKFRSMVQDADKKLSEIKHLGLKKDDAFFKIKDDPRITKIGKFIRKYSIDELPQLFNVLKGDMSLVGPRPILPTEEKTLQDKYFYRLNKIFRVLPGITGLWQISGRSLLSDEKRIELDRFYVEHWTLAMDVKILIKTFFVVVFHKGAF